MPRLRLNVGGTVFVTTTENLQRYPQTRLASLDMSSDSYDVSSNEFYFDRDPNAFNCILNMYRTSELHLPSNLCGNAIERELEFWRIPKTWISECCWRTLHQTTQDMEVLQTLKQRIIDNEVAPFGVSLWEVWRHRIWTVLDRPNSSKVAKIWSYVFMMFVATSVTIYCIETVPVSNLTYFQDSNESELQQYLNATTNRRNVHLKIETIFLSEPNTALEITDIVCLCVFTLELFLHWITSPNKCQFLKSFLNWIDIITFVAGWFTYGFEKAFRGELLPTTTNIMIGFIVVKSINVLRMFRFFRLAERFTSLKVMMLAVWKSKEELCLLIFSFVILSTMFGSFEYYCEFNNNKFSSIPISIWWAIVTMTTVGYGDYVPTTTCGYFVGSLCSLCGLIVLTMPVAVIVANFNAYHSRNKSRQRERKTEKRLDDKRIKLQIVMMNGQ